MSLFEKNVVGVLGGGQLGRMLIEAANRLNIKVIVLDSENAPAKKIHAHGDHIAGKFTNKESIEELAKSCDVITVEIEHVNTYVLEGVSEKVMIEPSWRTIRTIQDKFLQKEHLRKHSIPVVPYREVRENTVEELAAIGEDLGYPFMLKSKTNAYDGRGNYPVRSKDDLGPSLDFLTDRPLYGEKWAPFKIELAVNVVQTKNGVLSFPTVETIHEDSICKLVYAPPRGVSSSIQKRAQELARKTVAAFEGKGVYGVEMFLLDDAAQTLLINEIAPRPHNSGHHTIESCGMSQYDAHLRAILDFPIPAKSLELRQPAVMLNILGGETRDSHLRITEAALSVPNASIHLYDKGDARPGRKMGHITVAGPTENAAQAAITPLIDLVDKLRAERSDIKTPSPAIAKPAPTVIVTMGSDSDIPVLVDGIKLLERFGIATEVNITSAHRTPDYMALYAAEAASQGVKVIIAAAGGAAHLPGMAASHTILPVIGVPVKPSKTDGMDSLLSIVQMPRGIPVATVGIDNGINAALLAARIVGTFDPAVAEALEEYIGGMEREVMAKSEKIKKIGWEEYLKQMKK
ncbi:phosphoribosyl-aminoimidazole carboxylase [Patellaria atrata CBS 101060]|uniref:Phosphoribosylaminoimidazole carboxylase n=1 Tax=Patellaria atrata CBS 101060 TaxID=1346257 RepID=A0A9P4S451_9PEZI|nr:phosphoribosyl-aminoimidazole carboxylase [Patellaria atrata CBS 101060]